jgi:hypothetical protein
MNSGTKSKFDKKLLAAIAVIIIVIAALLAWQAPVIFQQPSASPNPSPMPTATSTPTLPEMTLTVVGANGTQVVLHAADVAALESYTAPGGFKSSGGYIAAVGNYTGVPVLALCDLVGGISSEQTLTVIASDGYNMVYTYTQVHGQDFTTYDPISGSEAAPTQPMKMVINYFKDGSPLPTTEDDKQGPLRIGMLGPEGLLTEGHFWTKMVSRIEVTANVRDWTVTVFDSGNATGLPMTRQALTADVNHFPLNWTDSNGNVWAGSALWRWVSWYNYNGGISNATLDQGYKAQVISGDGYNVTLDDSRVKMNDNIIVAVHLNGGILSDPYWPLTLVGSNVTSGESVKNIVQIKIVLDNAPASSPTPTATTHPSSSPAPTNTPAPTETPTASATPTPQDYSVTVNGTAAVSMTRAQFESQVAQVSGTFTDSNGGVYIGTPLHRIVAVWGTGNGAISSSALTDGYVVKVIASDGSTIALNDSRIDMNSNIFIANKYNGADLNSTTGWPLRLTGSDLSGGNQRLKSVVQIQIIPIPRSITLNIVAKNGTSYTLYSNDIVSLGSLTGNGGTRSSVGTLGNYGAYTGVSMSTIVSLYGGSSSSSIKVTASDSYSITYSYGQLSGQGVVSYNSAGSEVTPTQPQTMILAYLLNGTRIDSTSGPLRTMIVGPDGFYTTGSVSAKMVAKIEIL